MEPDELKARLRDHEDNWVERKTKNIKSEEICEALTGFANTLPMGQTGILFIGVHDDGTPMGVDDTDAAQKRVERWSKWCYPVVPYLARVIEDSGVHVVAVMVQASPQRPHFAGPAFVRSGSSFKRASEEKFNELIDRRNSLVDWILKERDSGSEIYIEDKRLPGSPRFGGKVIDCNPHYAVFYVPESNNEITGPIHKIYMSRNLGLPMFSIEP